MIHLLLTDWEDSWTERQLRRLNYNICPWLYFSHMLGRFKWNVVWLYGPMTQSFVQMNIIWDVVIECSMLVSLFWVIWHLFTWCHIPDCSIHDQLYYLLLTTNTILIDKICDCFKSSIFTDMRLERRFSCHLVASTVGRFSPLDQILFTFYFLAETEK